MDSEIKLLQNIKDQFAELEKLKEQVDFYYEEGLYRFYHHSFKVYYLQVLISKIVDRFRLILPEEELNSWFLQIVDEGTKEPFKQEHNLNWPRHARPIVEAFLHCKYFLEMMMKCKKYDTVGQILDYDIAGLLYLYNMR